MNLSTLPVGVQYAIVGVAFTAVIIIGALGLIAVIRGFRAKITKESVEIEVEDKDDKQ